MVGGGEVTELSGAPERKGLFSSHHKAIGRNYLLLAIQCAMVFAGFRFFLLGYSAIELFRSLSFFGGLFVFLPALSGLVFLWLPLQKGLFRLVPKVLGTMSFLLILLSSMMFLLSFILEAQERTVGIGDIGGGWTMYAPLATAPEPVHILNLGFIRVNLELIDLPLLATCMVLLAFLLNLLVFILTLLCLWKAGMRTRAFVWAPLLALLAGLVSLVFYYYPLFSGPAPVFNVIVFIWLGQGYMNLLFILVLGLASYVIILDKSRLGILKWGMLPSLLLCAIFIAAIPGRDANCLYLGAPCTHKASRFLDAGIYFFGEILSVWLLFSLWIGSRVRSQGWIVLLWFYAMIASFLIGSFLVAMSFNNQGEGIISEFYFFYLVGELGYTKGIFLCFALFAAVYYGLPRLTSTLFLKILVCFQLVFMLAGTQVILHANRYIASSGIPREMAGYPEPAPHFYVSVGNYLAIASVLFFFVILVVGFWSGKKGAAVSSPLKG